MKNPHKILNNQIQLQTKLILIMWMNILMAN